MGFVSWVLSWGIGLVWCGFETGSLYYPDHLETCYVDQVLNLQLGAHVHHHSRLSLGFCFCFLIMISLYCLVKDLGSKDPST